MLRSMTARRPAFEITWLVRPSRPRAPAHGLRGNMSWRRSPIQMAASSLVPSRWGCPATHAALTAPAEVPTSRSGVIPSSNRACSMPTWIAPRLPPPDRTNATRRVPPADSGSGRIFRRCVGRRAVSLNGFPGAPGALGPKRFQHHESIHPVPQPPVRLGPPYLVQERLVLSLQIRIRVLSPLHANLLTRKTHFTRWFGYHH